MWMSDDVVKSTDFDGYYVIINVPSGIYDLQVSMIGYDNYFPCTLEVCFGI